MRKGKYIVIEGATGSGKSTMLQLLATQLRAAQLPVKVLREPDNQNDVTARVLQHLIRDPRYTMNSHTEILLYNAARSQTLDTINTDIENGVICLVDRSYLTTLAIEYYGRGRVTDYQKLYDLIGFTVGDIQPDLLLVLDAPVAVLQERIQQDSDTHDEAFLERVRAGYLWEAKQRELPVVYATDSIEDVFKQVWQHVTETLAMRTTDSKPQSVAEVLAAKPPLKALSVEPPLVATTTTVADKLIQDLPDKLMQLDTIMLQNVSSLTAQKLLQTNAVRIVNAEQNQSFNQKDANNHYPYFVPTELKGKLRSQYIRTMNQLFDTYGTVMKQLTDHLAISADTATATQQAQQLAQLILPVALTTSLNVYPPIDQEAFTAFANDELPEARVIGKQLLPGADFSTIKTEQPLKALALELLPANHTTEATSFTLSSYAPHNELDIVTDVLYPYSDLPRQQLQRIVADWPYQQKLDIFSSSNVTKDINAQALITYNWDIVCDYASFVAIQLQGSLGAVQWQALSPRYGYDTPVLIEELGLGDIFDDCFDLSLQLYSALQSANLTVYASYATLFGHKLRWTYTSNLHALQQLMGANVGNRTILQAMSEKIAEVHPLITEIIATGF